MSAFTNMDYLEKKDTANRKLTELEAIFNDMEVERAAAADVVVTGKFATDRDALTKRYILAQMVICGMCAKLMGAAKQCLDT